MSSGISTSRRRRPRRPRPRGTPRRRGARAASAIRARISSRSSASVSNSEASAANSSSRSGSSFSRTSLTVTANWAAACRRAPPRGSRRGRSPRSSARLPPRRRPGPPRSPRPGCLGPSSTSWSLPLAALERLAVDGAAVVERDEVALGGGALDRAERGEALAQAVELGLDRLVGNLGLGLADLEPAVVAERRRRADRDLDRERQVLARGRQRRRRRASGSPTGGIARLEQGPLVPLAQRVRAAPARARPRARAAGSPAAAAPCPCGTRGASSRPRAPWRRGRCASRPRRPGPRRRSGRGSRRAL